MNYRNFLKTDSRDLDLAEVPEQRPDVLLGVSAAAATQLAALLAGTVFDLANSTLFNNAARVVDGAADPLSILGKHQGVPTELLDPAAAVIPWDQLPDSSVRNLAGVGATNGAAVEATFDVKSIRDLAFWPPFLAAKAIVTQAYQPFTALDYDKQSPEELIPRTGLHATQKVIYRKTLLIQTRPTTKVQWDGQSLDLAALDETGFSDVAFGAILTFHQLWTPRRAALGTLLHSLPLGPGESTRLAVVDWARRLRAASREDVNQSEELSNSLAQSTAISEVTQAVANQIQEGRSGGFSIAGSQSSGGTAFFGIGVGSASESINAAYASTYSTSNTSRSEAASAMQNIASQTHQNTSLARNKRAAVVTEVSQQESENLTTRVVTNFNHMHALSIQYYEVVQIYETELRQANVERCIFIPMRELNFWNESIVRKYLGLLIRYALDKRTRDLLLQYRDTLVLEMGFDRLATANLQQLIAAADALPFQAPGLGDTRGFFALPFSFEKRIKVQMLQNQIGTLRRSLAANAEGGFRLGFIEDFERNAFSKYTVDRGAELNDAFWETDSDIAAINLQLADGSQLRLTTPGVFSGAAKLNPGLTIAVPLSQLRGVTVEIAGQNTPSPSDFAQFKLHLQLALNGRIFWFDASFVHSRGFGGTLTLFTLHTPVDFRELGARLMEQQLYYSQQVWLRADSQALLMQLAPYTLDLGAGGIHIVDYIDPQPITVAGNYLAFRFTFDEDKEWRAWVDKQRKERPRYDLLPVPTGGVFAEAVLGEFNSAEKLDATRFWKWQDSPIPNAAPEIAALDASATPARVDAPTPGPLQASGIVKVQDLQELPSGLATSKDLLGALMAENIFKNMGGVEITGKLLQAAQAAAAAGDKSTQELLSGTAKGIMTAFEGLATSFLKSPDGVQNITQLGSILNNLGGSGGGGAGGLSGLLGGGAGAGGAGAGAGAGDAAGAASAGGAMEAIGPLMEEIAPLVLLA